MYSVSGEKSRKLGVVAIDCCCWVNGVGGVGRTGRDSSDWTSYWSRYHMKLSDWSRRVLGAGDMTDNREYDGDHVATCS